MVRLIRLLIPTILNVVLINYAASRAQAEGDSDLFTAAILLVCLITSAGMFIQSVSKMRAQFNWDTTLLLVVCFFNLYYFFKVYICCVPVVGSF